jgi:LuxR family transcriptional regulator, maltose regulon positive regulatory protein
VLASRAAAELWSGHLEEAAQVLRAGLAAVPASGQGDPPADCLGYLALAEALRGRLRLAGQLAGQATAAQASGTEHPPVQNLGAAALVALARVNLERHQLRQARSSLKRADAVLGISPDKLIAAVAYLVAADSALAEGQPAAVAQLIARARAGWPVPGWLDHQLTLAESRARAAAGDLQAALAVIQRTDGTSPEAAVTLAQIRAAAGDSKDARSALTPILAVGNGAPDAMRVRAWLVHARLSYDSGDDVCARRSIARAMRLAEPEQLRLPFAMEHRWLEPALQRDPELASLHRRLLGHRPRHQHHTGPVKASDQAVIPVVDPLSEREQEVLRHVSGLLSNAEVAGEMYISVNTVKTHLRSIYRKLSTTHRGEAVRRARQLELI